MTSKTMQEREQKQAALDALYAPHKDFINSPLYIAGACTSIVFGEGNPCASIMIIGEAPGEEEDRQGRPFVGRSGKLLNKALELSGLNRLDIYITNIAKCRPPNNRTPTPEELEIGRSTLLLDQIKIISPRVICTLGAAALTGLTKASYKITQIRGQPIDFNGTMLIPTLHPAYVLRNPKSGDQFLSDIKFLAFLASC